MCIPSQRDANTPEPQPNDRADFTNLSLHCSRSMALFGPAMTLTQTCHDPNWDLELTLAALQGSHQESGSPDCSTKGPPIPEDRGPCLELDTMLG